MFNNFLFQLRALFHRRSMEAELDAELRAHIEHQTEKHVRSGMSPEEAARRARLELGGVEQIKEDVRDSWGVRFISELAQDVRYGLRQLSRNPGFTAVAVLTLALGIGANTAIFSVVNAVLLEPLPYQNPSRLVYISEFWPRERPADKVPTPDFANWQEHNQVFQSLASWGRGRVNLAGNGNPESVEAAQVSEEFFSTLGVRPVLGRTFLAKEEQPGAEHVVILTYALWRQRFGSDRGIISKSVTIDGQPYAVVGVLPAGFRFPDDEGEPQLFRPNVAATVATWHSAKDFRIQDVVARLVPGVSLSAAKAQLMALTARTRDQESPQFIRMREGMEVRIIPLQQRLTGSARPLLFLLACAVGLVLLIACVNVACLELARATTRRMEIALRAAIGAARGRIARQLLTESLLLAALGGASGLIVSYWAVELIRVVWPQQIPRFIVISIDGRVLAFCVLVTLLTGVLFGLVPAFSAYRRDLNGVFQESRMAGGKPGRLRGPLAASELALATMLLVGSGLLIRTFIHLATIDPGFDVHHLLTLQVALPPHRYQQHGQQAAFFDQLLQRVRSLPGVQSADISTGLPTEGSGYLAGMGVEGQPLAPPGLRPDVPFDTVSPGYFHTLRIPLTAGRLFTSDDQRDSPIVAIVNEAFVRRFFPGENPLGKRVYTGAWRKVVGVVGDVRQQGPLHPPRMEVYGPYTQGPTRLFLVVRSAANPRTLAAEVRIAVTGIDKTQPIYNVATMEQRLAGSIAAQRFNMILVGAFGALALLLATVGLYGVISYSMSQRTHEIGIRMALGAEKRDVLRMVIGQGLKLALIGVAIGVVGALALTRFLSSLLYGVKPTDPLTFIAVSLILIAVALLACYIPARRAAKVEPMVALRYE